MSTGNSFPLLDLHRHLDGNIRVSSIVELARQHSIALPTYDVKNLASIIHIEDKTSDLLAFIQKLDLGVSVLADIDACARVAYENVVDAKNEGLDYVELRFSPFYMAQAFNLPLDGVVEAVVDGVQRANLTLGFNANLIGIMSRTYGEDACMRELKAILKQSKHIVAIDLAGDEKTYPCRRFIKHFNLVRDAGLKITIHAGEADGPQSIWDAIKRCGANRIGHGVAAYQDDKLMDYLSKEAIGVECCLLSNYQTGTWLDTPSHPLSTFLERGIEVFLNTDDPGVSNNTLKSEYQIAKNVIGLSTQKLSQLSQNAINQAFLCEHEKQIIRNN